MFRRVAKQVSRLSIQQRQAAPVFQTQQAGYAVGKQEGLTNLWEHLYNPYTEFAPKDPYQPTWNPSKKISFTLCDEVLARIKFQKLERVDLYAYNSGARWRRNLWSGGRSIFSSKAGGFVGIGVAHASNHYLLPPQVMRLVYNEDKVDYWYVGGGLCFTYNYGPVHVNAFGAFTLDELDKDLVNREMENFSEQMRSRNPGEAAIGQIGYDCMKVMHEGLEAVAAKKQ